MAPLTLSLLFLSLALSASSLVTPHVARSHHDIANAFAALPIPVAVLPLHKRTPRRCKNRPPKHPAPSPSPSKAPAEVGGSPTYGDNPPPTPKPSVHKPHAPKPPASDAPAPKPPAPKPPAPKPKPPPPAPPQNAGGPSFMRGTQTGQGTFYATGLGACGITNKDTDYIAAASHLLFDAFPGYSGGNPNNNPICGRRVRVNYGGKSVTVVITDRCAACAITDLDFSPSAFNQLADFALGRIDGIKWDWI